ncbi:MAG: WxcM-like domain-containing protein [Niabella sp.]
MMQESPFVIEGACYRDDRGELRYNNAFDASPVKRLYLIQNSESIPVRGWQGHRIEQRWFIAVAGAFEINTVKVDDWENPSKDLLAETFKIDQKTLNILYAPPGYITKIHSLEKGSVLLAMSDYLLGEIKDEYRFSPDYFTENSSK